MKKYLQTVMIAGSLATVAQAYHYEMMEPYKDPKVMGMGGANVAVGGGSYAVFSNPAGLSTINKDHGVEFNLINFNLHTNANTVETGQDIIDTFQNSDNSGDSSNTQQLKDILDIFADKLGKNYHLGASGEAVSLAYKGDEIGWTIGGFGGANANIKVHQGLGTEGFVEIVGGGYGLGTFGLSYDILDSEIGDYVLNDFTLGVSTKYGYTASFSKNIGLNDVTDTNKEIVTEDDYSVQPFMVFDIGGMYEVVENLRVGASLMDIGGIGESGTAYYVPMTVNAGVALDVFKTNLSGLTVAADYRDMTGAYGDLKPYNVADRIRAGATLTIWDGWFSRLALSGGIYQGEYTAGADVMLSPLGFVKDLPWYFFPLYPLGFEMKVAAATYAEQIGAYNGQDVDRRYIIQLGLGW